jgi:hypothetical protein
MSTERQAASGHCCRHCRACSPSLCSCHTGPFAAVGRLLHRGACFRAAALVSCQPRAFDVVGCSPTRGSARARPAQSFVDVQPAAEVEAAAAEQPVRQRQMQPSLTGSAGCADGYAATSTAAASLPEATDAWALVEHMLRSWPPGTPLLLLAACHVPLSTLPAPLSQCFASTSEQVRWSVHSSHGCKMQGTCSLPRLH